jgi:hypothetical protein
MFKTLSQEPGGAHLQSHITWEAEMERIGELDQTGQKKKIARPPTQWKSLSWRPAPVILVTVWSVKQEDLRPGKKQDPISKITREKEAGDIAQEVEHLPSKH